MCKLEFCNISAIVVGFVVWIRLLLAKNLLLLGVSETGTAKAHGRGFCDSTASGGKDIMRKSIVVAPRYAVVLSSGAVKNHIRHIVNHRSNKLAPNLAG